MQGVGKALRLEESTRPAMLVVLGCFFFCGFSSTLNDALIPYLRRLFQLSYLSVMCIQLSFYLAYFSVCPIAGFRLSQWGYKKGLAIGLLLGALGCLSLLPAIALQFFPIVLPAVFTLGAGVAILHVAANPLALALGSKETAAVRLTFAQSFTALGMVVAPSIGSLFMEGNRLPQLYVGTGLGWLIMAGLALVFLVPISIPDAGSLRKTKGLKLTLLAIFTYVGVEVSVGGFLVSFLCDPQVAGLSMSHAARYCSIYWGGMFLGRLLAAPLMRASMTAPILQFNSLMAAALLVLGSFASSHLAMWSVLLVGVCNSVMFPAIFSLGMSRGVGAGPRIAGILCMANIGGAVWPLAQGLLADATCVRLSFLVPSVGYLGLWCYGIYMSNRKEELA